MIRSHAKGGIGEVFVAEDAELRRQVALKEIQSRFADEDGSQARFVREAEVTGRLEHPGVVPVYGLGRYADGRPFYAMRFIGGESFKEAIERYHATAGTEDDKELEFRGLLGRFITVCQTVAYAHAAGVLHRDLKPANVMLGPYGETVVVDWGLAKVVGEDEAAAGVDWSDGFERPLDATPPSVAPQSTLPGTPLGTPAYMSPEQATGRVDDLGPATDVYSLGATLFHLLVGEPPFTKGRVEEILHRVAHGDAPAPRDLRQTTPAALDAISRKAMALRPQDRYASALDLARDVERWLADEPVSVHRDSAATRLLRWARRHRTWAIGTTAALVTAVVGLTVGAVVLGQANQRTAAERDRADEQRQAAEAARADAEAVLSFFVTDLLGQAAPDQNPVGAKVTVKEVLDRASAGLKDADFGGRPHVEAAVRLAIGGTYEKLGALAEADQHLETARRKFEAAYGREHPRTLDAIDSLGGLRLAQGKLGDAERLFDEALALRRRERGDDHPDSLESEHNLALVRLHLGRFADAERLFRRVLDVRRRALGELDRRTTSTLHNLAAALMFQNRLDEAEALHRERLAATVKSVGDKHADVVEANNALAAVLAARGKREEAAAIHRRNAEVATFVFGPDHPITLTVRGNVATALAGAGRLEEAEAMLRDVLDKERRVQGPQHAYTLATMRQLAEVQERRGRPANAAATRHELVDAMRRSLAATPERHGELAAELVMLALALMHGGKPAEAEAPFREAAALDRKHRAAGHWATGNTLSQLGECLTVLGKHAEAERVLLEGQQALASPETPAGWREAGAGRLARLYERMGRPADAAKWRGQVERAPK